MEDFDVDIDEATLRRLIRYLFNEYEQKRPLQPHNLADECAYVVRRLCQILPVWDKLSADPNSGR